MFRKVTRILFISLFIACLPTISVMAQTVEFCQTWEIFQQDQFNKYGEMYHDCYNGICDDPTNRDANIPGPNDPIKYIRLYFNIFCEDNGSNCATTAATLVNQVAELNAVYLPMRIQFEYDYRFVNSTLYRHYYNAHDMKVAYAVNPDQQLNVYITDAGGGSFGTFPWDDVRLPLSADGGVVLDDGHVYPAPYHDNVLAHEIGHTIGLWHTHHGVYEVDLCGDCYERADGLNADITGDLCSETPPTPINYNCQDPGGSDYCSSTAWGTTDYHNFMSYAPINGSNCWTHFDPQQWGRIHCWVDNVLSSWLVGVALHVNMVFPTQNALDVSITNPIYATFDTDMDSSTINNLTFLVSGRNNGEYQGTISYYPSGRFAIFFPSEDLVPGEEITVVFTDGVHSSTGTSLTNGFTWSFTTASCAYADFGPSIEYATYANPNKATAADFNGDGFVDIATSSQTRNYVSILLNNGSGGFPTHTDIYLGDSHGPNGICAADFTGDGFIDLATSNYASDNVTILANNGYGGFSIQGEYQVIDIHGGCYPADMNGDGSIDLVIGIGSGIPDYIAVFYNNGNGTFSQLTRLEVLDNPFDPKAADFNNDGALDLVIVNAWSDSAGVFLNDGEGGFGPRVDYYTGDRPLEVATADLNGDGYVDFAVCNKTDNKVTIHMNDGNGGFGLYSTVSPLYGPEAINAADFDGDGDMDLVTANRDDMSVTILWNNGSASFTIDALDDYCDTQMYCSGVDIVAADLDGEGSIDLFTVNIDDNGTISVMKNFGPPAAPLLYSPVNGKTFTAPAQPTLNCYDVATALFYNFQIDDDPNFGSPISSPTFLAESQWTVSQSLGAGTYYWHARAINSCGYGQWSDVWTIVLTSGGGSSCPVLFSYNGREFIEENPILTACEKSGYVDIVTDYYHVNNEVVPVNGKVTFQLKEVEDEITYLDNFELITVDHSTSTGVGCSVDGQIFTYQTSIAPLSVIDQDGTDWTAIVQESDGESFASEISGALLVVFPNIESSAGISIDAVTKSPCPYEDPGDPPKAAVNNYAPSSMVVEQLTADGNWVVLSDVPSRENPAGALIMNDPSLAGNAENITIRITWEGRFSTDEIRQYIPSDETPLIRTLAADNFRLNLKNPAPKVWQGFESSGRLELRRDEFIEFSFDVDNIDDPSMTRDYIIRAVGRYHPDYSVFTHLMPNQFQLYNNYPNPFNPSTKIAYDLPSPVQVKVEVINILGRHVATLVDESQPAGHYEVIWNGRDNNGNDVSSGIYLYRLTAGDFTSSKKMILQK